jgi:FkbM family methyltransferase
MNKFSFFEFLDLPEKIFIVDVGAAVDGQPERYAGLLEHDRAHVYACEPDEAARNTLPTHYRKNLTVIPDFLGDGRESTFYQTNRSPTSSLFRPNPAVLDLFPSIGDVTRVEAVRRVATKKLDDVDGIEDCDFIKIDVQGAEIEVLSNARRILDMSTLIQTEVCFLPLYANQPLFGDIDIFLRQKGFAFHTFAGVALRPFRPLPFTGERAPWMNQYAWGDAVYIKDPTQLGGVPVPKLFKLAALMHEFYDSYDLTALLLGEVDARLGTGHQAAYLAWLKGHGML